MAAIDQNDDAIDTHVEQILDELVGLALRTAGDPAPIGDAVERWWRNQYKAKFFYAIRMKDRTYATDQPKLRQKAEELGKVARRLAGLEPITTLHAALASHEVDCPPIFDMEHWCN